MAKIKIKSVPKMQVGGYSNPPTTYMPYAPVTSAERDAWEKMQSSAYQEGFLGSEHSRQPGIDYMRAHGVDPNRLPAYQQDILQQRSADPWNRGTAVRAGEYGFSPADTHYGRQTARERYTQYQVQAPGQPVKDFGTNWQAATDYSNQYDASKKGIGSKDWQTTGWENFGNPKADINYRGADAVTPMNRPMLTPASMPSGLAATGFPTREEAIAKYKERKASGKELPSNYFTDKRKETGDPIGILRSTGEETYKYGGMKKKIRIVQSPDSSPIMWAGGYASKGPSHGYGNQQVGHGYALDRFWSSPTGYPGGTAKVSPYHSVGNTLPEAKNGGDINAEKQERVLGDFDQDGQQELMNVNGKPHTQGGKDINVPSNSFVFSDTKALKIKDSQILAMFGMAPKKGGYTPAEIAKKYDLNKLKKVLDDPNADEVAKKTAQLLNDNYLSKLNKLAAVQESIKKHMGMEHHDPTMGQQPAQPPVQEVGNMGQGGEEMMQPEVMFKYGGAPMAQFGNTGIRPVANWFVDNSSKEANSVANEQVAQSVSPVYNMYPSASSFNNNLPKDNTPLSQEDVAFFTKAALSDPIKYAELYGKGRTGASLQGKGRLDVWGPGYRNIKMGMPEQDISSETIQPLPLVPVKEMSTVPYTPKEVAAQPYVSKYKKDKKDKKTMQWPGLRIDPNFYGDAMNLLQMAQVKKFEPYEPVPQAVIPETVFVDPTRAIAAQQENARNAMEMAAQGDQRAARATMLGIQGEAGKQAADVIGQYGNQNVQIANAANAQAAQITNELMAKQANRLAELNKANFLSDRDYQREMGRLQAEYADRMQKHHDTAVKTAWLNKTSPYFDIDPVTQMPVFKSPEAEAEYWKTIKGAPDSTVADRVTALRDKGYSVDEALKIIGLEKGKLPSKSAEDVVSKYGGQVMQYGGSHMAMPKMAPRYQRNAERLPYYQIGGTFIPLSSGPEIPLNAIDNLSYQQSMTPPQQTMILPEGNPLAGMKTKKASKRDIATITNNPGNMKYSTWMKKYGAVPSGIPGTDGGEFAEFPDLNAGLQAYKMQIFGDTDGVFESNYYKANTPVDTALKTWSNKGYGAEIYPEIRGKKLGQLTPQEREELIRRQIKRESKSMYTLLQQRGVIKKYGGNTLQKFIK